ncbi:patatin-like phospholipase family protein [Solirubrobacter ginsenosidimutans]|uniref:Patatin-like phospholipase family protein n=1 Tax=Solirubrobacter ginsenosidimutans TaxID=490573 RepID=A0A9X3N2U6_9ACTN|nr:patatin-like phospholipase family protein [Solirubrobacter ginsenosidimutans]MDA0165667.1 patatin-like phospholipase family protein [Solirubrobacter ginsenosidimutans]
MGAVARLRQRRAVAPTAFVLSGGGSLGALQAGMLRALYERRIVPDMLVATSAGALNAGFVASRPQTLATADALADVWRGMRRDDIFPVRPWAIAAGMLARRDHLIAPDRLRRLIAHHIEFDDLSDSAIPLHIVTFDVKRSEEVVLSSGPAVDALTAAASIPGVLPPVTFGDRRLVDGGVVNNIPISRALALGARRIFVLPTRMASTPGVRYRHGGLGPSADGLPPLTARRLAAHLARYSAEIVPLPAPNPLDVSSVDFAHAGRLIADATAAAHLRLDEVLDGQGEPFRASLGFSRA